HTALFCAPLSHPSFPTRRSSDLFTALQTVLGPAEVDVSLDDVHAPENCRPCSGSPQMKISIPRELGQRGLHLQLWRGNDMHVERSEEHTSELQSPDHLVCRLLLE